MNTKFISVLGLLIVLSLVLVTAVKASPLTVTPTNIVDVTYADPAVAGVVLSMYSLLLCCIYCVPLLISFVWLMFFIWTLINVIQRQADQFPEPRSNDQKTMWLLIILLTGGIGSVVYYIMVYRATKKHK